MNTMRWLTHMALTALFEQLTALLSKNILREVSLPLTTSDTPQRLHWHTREELAHSHAPVEEIEATGVWDVQYRVAFSVSPFYMLRDSVGCTALLRWSDAHAGHTDARRVTVRALGFSLSAMPSFRRVVMGGTQCARNGWIIQR